MRFILFIFILAACSDRPSRERFPGVAGRTTDLEAGANAQAIMGGFDSLANSRKEVQSSKTLKGKVVLAKNVKIPAGASLFLVVRSMTGGPPLAARKLSVNALPYEFVLSQSDAMIQGTPFEGHVQVLARIDQDGVATTQQPGDASGLVQTEVGDQNVLLTISDVVE